MTSGVDRSRSGRLAFSRRDFLGHTATGLGGVALFGIDDEIGADLGSTLNIVPAQIDDAIKNHEGQ